MTARPHNAMGFFLLLNLIAAYWAAEHPVLDMLPSGKNTHVIFLELGPTCLRGQLFDRTLALFHISWSVGACWLQLCCLESRARDPTPHLGIIWCRALEQEHTFQAHGGHSVAACQWTSHGWPELPVPPPAHPCVLPPAC